MAVMNSQDRFRAAFTVACFLGFLSGCGGITNLNKTADPGAESSSQPVTIFSDPDSTPADDSPYAQSPQRQVGQGFSIDIFGGEKKEGDDPSQLAIDDPEYAEYLEWKRWQEFKAYQEWKAQQVEAETAS
ncbi:MAG: hypothetical protein CL400_03650 [Acidiferrobacteraceae bacterium]|jgi:hypothetical protein|nr:hypothetical protein [Acidiferrobacteraceae bacterium]|tara:strand:- start:614 stop:1003 length:390 start_codon:yes stop_codon:yes gene_type:complete